MPESESCSVLGIGVAVNVNVSTFLLIDAIFSLWLTPKRCSSSIIKSPKSLNDKSFYKILCVPINISILPSDTFLNISLVALSLLNLDT